MAELLRTLSTVTGLPPAERRFPSIFPKIAGYVSSFVEGDVLGREPRVSLEAAQMASTTMTFDDSRAREEIGYSSRPRRSHSLIPRSGSSNTATSSPGGLK